MIPFSQTCFRLFDHEVMKIIQIAQAFTLKKKLEQLQRTCIEHLCFCMTHTVAHRSHKAGVTLLHDTLTSNMFQKNQEISASQTVSSV